jgi:hypothetical protein
MRLKMNDIAKNSRSCALFGTLILGLITGTAQSADAQEFCRTINVPIPSIRAWHLPHEGTGDTEMEGHNPRITIRANISRDGPRLILDGTVEMREAVQDFTTFLGNFTRRIFDIDLEAPGCAYRDFGPRSGSLDADSGEDNHDWTFYQNGNGIVRAANCLSDTVGNDAGRLGCTIDFADITVALVSAQTPTPGAVATPGPASTPRPTPTPTPAPAPTTERPPAPTTDRAAPE